MVRYAMAAMSFVSQTGRDKIGTDSAVSPSSDEPQYRMEDDVKTFPLHELSCAPQYSGMDVDPIGSCRMSVFAAEPRATQVDI